MTDIKDFPIEDVVAQVNERLSTLHAQGMNAFIHQKWTCQHCGARQTMEDKDVFHRAGKCEECSQFSIIDRCNYVLFIEGGKH